MKRYVIFAAMILCFGLLAQAQSISLRFAWDKSASDTPEQDAAGNPVLYKLCFSAAMPSGYIPPDVKQCLTPMKDLEATVSFTAGTHYVFVNSQWLAVDVDGVPIGTDIAESTLAPTAVDPSRYHLRVRIHVPPGNPANIKVQILP